MLTEKSIEKIRALENRYPDKRSLVIAALWAVQREGGGNLTEQDLKEVAGVLDLAPVEVQAVATFYSMYNLIEPYKTGEPAGRYHIQVCRSISCSLLDSEVIIEHLEKTLHIKIGETTPDGKFSLTVVECLGSCGTAPMMQINDDYYESLTVEKVDEILGRLE
ncbi:MAG: NAD(P)H-dependent oxidoreductase subunit E [Desulfobacteraceae bacterium]|nr:MAG: NAD(P)H-dependent oxidoreductase subunit E [Desulfobacteraceae bacterium]